MTALYRTALFVAACSIPAAVSARSDSQIWTAAAASFKLSDRWRLSEEVVTRFSDNRNGLYEIESVTLLGYRIAKDVTIAAASRYRASARPASR